jgi:hypothetical protein
MALAWALGRLVSQLTIIFYRIQYYDMTCEDSLYLIGERESLFVCSVVHMMAAIVDPSGSFTIFCMRGAGSFVVQAARLRLFEVKKEDLDALSHRAGRVFSAAAFFPQNPFVDTGHPIPRTLLYQRGIELLVLERRRSTRPTR